MEAGRGPSQVMDLTFAWDDGAWREGFVYAGEVSPISPAAACIRSRERV